MLNDVHSLTYIGLNYWSYWIRRFCWDRYSINHISSFWVNCEIRCVRFWILNFQIARWNLTTDCTSLAILCLFLWLELCMMHLELDFEWKFIDGVLLVIDTWDLRFIPYVRELKLKLFDENKCVSVKRYGIFWKRQCFVCFQCFVCCTMKTKIAVICLSLDCWSIADR